jgi:C-terminal processing protease CtpA/Prc
MQASKFVLTLACAAMVVSCGGGGSSPTPSPSATTPAPTPTPTSTTANCSYTARSQFVRDTFNEWYLFPELLNTGANPASYTDLQDYIDALVAPARAQGRDRYFSYITSIAEENAFYEGGASAGFGFRLFYDTGASKVFVTETFEGTSALGANVDRGSEVLGVGTTSSNIVSVTTLMARGGAYAVYEALGPSNAGVTRVLRVRDQGGVEREVSLTKTEFALDPVSNRYGAKIIDDGGRRVGYLNFRTFIDPAVPDLRAAFANFRAQGVTELVIDLRYNGGGLVSIAELMGDLMARDLDGRVFYELALRPSKAAENEIYRFDAQPQSVAPTRVAFIGTGETASASELVVNGMQPYLGDRMALVGENTYGKPVGQAAFDLPGCDDRVRVIAFKLANADGEGEYFNGLAATVPNACRAEDDVTFQLGDPREGMLASALDFLAGRACTPIISAASARRVAVDDGERGMLRAEVPGTVAQREVPGLN